MILAAVGVEGPLLPRGQRVAHPDCNCISPPDMPATCHRGLLRVSPPARDLLTSRKGGSRALPSFGACISEGCIWCPTRVQQFEVTRRGGTWAGNEVSQGWHRSCVGLSSEHFFRLTLPAACSRNPGEWDSLGHGDFRAMFQKPRHWGQFGTWPPGRVGRGGGSGLSRGRLGPRTRCYCAKWTLLAESGT